MPQITFVMPNGTRQTLKSNNGSTLMEVAKYNNIDGILAECGGCCACGTCHVFIEKSYLDQIPPINEYEKEILNDTAVPKKDNSRLSCQIKMTDKLDGMVVTIAPEQ